MNYVCNKGLEKGKQNTIQILHGYHYNCDCYDTIIVVRVITTIVVIIIIIITIIIISSSPS